MGCGVGMEKTSLTEHTGTEVLRRGLNPKEASKAFILDMADNRTIDLVSSKTHRSMRPPQC